MFNLFKAQVGDILQYKVMPDDFWGKIIDFLTLGGGYSHTAIYLGSNEKAEAREKGLFGTHKITEDIQMIDVYRVKGGLTSKQKALIQEKVKQLYGTKYDYLGLISTLRSTIGLLLNWKWLRQSLPVFNDYKKWYCSEIASHIYLKAIGIDIVPDVSCYITTPNDIARSKVLERIS